MSKWPEDLRLRLTEAAPEGLQYDSSTDAKGVSAGWATLAAASDLHAVARVLKDAGARLSTASAFQPRPVEEERPEREPPTFFGGLPFDGETYEIDYHFDFAGDTLTVVVHLPTGGSVPSLTPLWRTANWIEREFMELYAIAVEGHPDPRRLFVDDSIDPAVFERLIPHSTLVNAASTKGLWEAIMASKDKPA